MRGQAQTSKKNLELNRTSNFGHAPLQQLDVYTVTWFRFLSAFGILAIYLTLRQKLPTVRQIPAASGKLLAIAIFKERYTLRQWAGMAVLILALSLFFYEQLNIAPEPLTLLGFTGAILVVAGCMAIALGKSSSVRP